MNAGKALAIVKNIEKAPYTDNKKAEAIYEVMEMATHNSITKADMLNVIKWLWNKFYTMEQDDTPMTNYERIKNMSVEEMAENLLGGHAFCPYWIYSNIGKCAKPDCQKCIKQWLESEVETE